jgi:hypothetical protein
MSDTVINRPSKIRYLVWSAVGAGLLLVAAANYHLVYVAIASQPDCVEHVRTGQGATAPGLFAAAKSSCSVK